MQKRITPIICAALAACLVVGCPINATLKASADNTSSVAETVSANLNIKCSFNGVPVSGMVWRIYHVADIADGRYVLTSQFADSGVDLNAPTDSAFQVQANALSVYAAEHTEIIPQSTETDSDGKAVFGVAEKGLYLLAADEVSTDSYKYSSLPALVGVTEENSGET